MMLSSTAAEKPTCDLKGSGALHRIAPLHPLAPQPEKAKKLWLISVRGRARHPSSNAVSTSALGRLPPPSPCALTCVKTTGRRLRHLTDTSRCNPGGRGFGDAWRSLRHAGSGGAAGAERRIEGSRRRRAQPWCSAAGCAHDPGHGRAGARPDSAALDQRASCRGQRGRARRCCRHRHRHRPSQAAAPAGRGGGRHQAGAAARSLPTSAPSGSARSPSCCRSCRRRRAATGDEAVRRRWCC